MMDDKTKDTDMGKGSVRIDVLKNKINAILDSGEPFVFIAGTEMGHTYFTEAQSWRETLGLVEVLRTVIRQEYKRVNKAARKKREREDGDDKKN